MQLCISLRAQLQHQITSVNTNEVPFWRNNTSCWAPARCARFRTWPRELYAYDQIRSCSVRQVQECRVLELLKPFHPCHLELIETSPTHKKLSELRELPSSANTVANMDLRSPQLLSRSPSLGSGVLTRGLPVPDPPRTMRWCDSLELEHRPRLDSPI